MPTSHPTQAAPVCQEHCVDAAKVDRLRPRLAGVTAAAPVFKALADATRLKIVCALAEEELCVCDVAALLDASAATASYHLRLLHHLGLAQYRREGKLVYYRLADPRLGHLVRAALQHLANHGA